MAKIRALNLEAYIEEDRGSLKRIADALGLTPSTVSGWKSGRRPVPSEYTQKICEILGRSEDDLCKPFTPGLQLEPDNEVLKMILKELPFVSEAGLKKVLATVLQQLPTEPPTES